MTFRHFRYERLLKFTLNMWISNWKHSGENSISIGQRSFDYIFSLFSHEIRIQSISWAITLTQNIKQIPGRTHSCFNKRIWKFKVIEFLLYAILSIIILTVSNIYSDILSDRGFTYRMELLLLVFCCCFFETEI